MIDLREQEGLVTPIPCGNHLHWARFKHNEDGSIAKTLIDGRVMPIVLQHMPACPICAAESEAFGELVHKHGSHNLAVRISKREAFRIYDRKYPFDMASKAVSLDAIEESLGYEPEQDEEIDATARISAFVDTLTPRQRFVFERAAEGYRPKDTAALLGKPESTAVRWHLHMVRKRLALFLLDNSGEPEGS
jgi:DNA-binding CsgD family transcriptional regulator